MPNTHSHKRKPLLVRRVLLHDLQQQDDDEHSTAVLSPSSSLSSLLASTQQQEEPLDLSVKRRRIEQRTTTQSATSKAHQLEQQSMMRTLHRSKLNANANVLLKRHLKSNQRPSKANRVQLSDNVDQAHTPESSSSDSVETLIKTAAASIMTSVSGNSHTTGPNSISLPLMLPIAGQSSSKLATRLIGGHDTTNAVVNPGASQQLLSTPKVVPMPFLVASQSSGSNRQSTGLIGHQQHQQNQQAQMQSFHLKLDTNNKKEKRNNTPRSVIKQKLEDAFKQNGFLVKTKQVSDGDATFCKFRQLRKYTRYYLKSWHQHLPLELEKLWKGFLPPKAKPTNSSQPQS